MFRKVLTRPTTIEFAISKERNYKGVQIVIIKNPSRFIRGWILFFSCLLLLQNPAYSKEKLVQIAIEIAEVNNTKAREVGIKWLDSMHVAEAVAPVGSLNVLSDIGARTRSVMAGDIKLLLEKGAAELLANPKLIVKSGASASFKAGGEMPYIGAGSATSGPTVEFKEYGIKLEIQPTILSGSEDIHVVLLASVSSIDYSKSATMSGNIVPGILNREVTTDVNVKGGTTITIAGLVQTKKEKVTKGIPLLGEIPILGLLFSHQKWINNKTTVVIFLTPTIYEQ